MTDELDGIEALRRTAALARLEVEEASVERLGRELTGILAAFRTLTELDDLGDADAMVRAGGETGRLRADEPRPSLSTEDALANAPRRTDAFYSVPKTVGGGP